MPSKIRNIHQDIFRKNILSAADITNSHQKRYSLLFTGLTIAVMSISGCSESQQYAESASEESIVSETEQVADLSDDILGIVDQGSGVTSKTDKLGIENLAGDSEQTLGSQVADIQIKGKELLITANANFKVEDVVKSSNAIESLTLQQGGYVALSKITNVESDSRTFIKGEQNVTLTTYYRQATMTVRIPREKVSGFLKQVQQQVAFLNEQAFSAQDVTLDIYREQLAAKLNSDMASDLARERLNSKNNKDQRSNVDAITATYAVRQQQEYAQLEKMDIADKVKYSTIDFTFTQPNSSYKEVTQNLDIIIDAERPSFSTQVIAAFKEGWEILKTVAITLIQLWWLVVLFGIFYLIYRLIKAIYRKFSKHKPLMSAAKRKEWFGEDEREVKKEDTDIK